MPEPRVPPYVVTSVASSHEVEAGTEVHDTIAVVDLGADRTITITSRLYGPVPVPATGSCLDVDWLTVGPPVAAFLGTRDVTGDLTFDTGSVRLTEPGCYSFAALTTNHFLTGGEVRVGHWTRRRERARESRSRAAALALGVTITIRLPEPVRHAGSVAFADSQHPSVGRSIRR